MEEDDEFDKELKFIGFLVTQFNELELKASKILTLYVKPSKDKMEFFESHFLNNSVISFGAKIKLITAINKKEKLIKLDKNKFHRILALRNAIVHNDILAKFKVHIPEDPEDDILRYFVMDHMKSDGTVTTVNKSDAYSDFLMLYEELNQQLEVMLEKLC